MSTPSWTRLDKCRNSRCVTSVRSLGCAGLKRGGLIALGKAMHDPCDAVAPNLCQDRKVGHAVCHFMIGGPVSQAAAFAPGGHCQRDQGHRSQCHKLTLSSCLSKINLAP
jgi:hypothetical protein